MLGANDGIVFVAGLLVGVAGVTTDRGPLFTAGIAGLVAGAVSMALGEYVSVSSQRDSEKAQLATEKRELRDDPETELAELAALYEAKGLRPETARTVAHELTEHDALAPHAALRVTTGRVVALRQRRDVAPAEPARPRQRRPIARQQ